MILLTPNWHPAPWWKLSWMFTLVETFVWLWHSRDAQFSFVIILEEFVILIERYIGKWSLSSLSAAQGNRSSLGHRMDGAHQDNIAVCQTSQKILVFSCSRDLESSYVQLELITHMIFINIWHLNLCTNKLLHV